MVVIKCWSNDVIFAFHSGRTREYTICPFQQIIPVYGPPVQVKILHFWTLAGYACIVHGSQACPYCIVWIDMATFFAAAHAYVSFSWARSLPGLYILTYPCAAFLVDPYYVQLWNWFVAQMFWHPRPFNKFLLTKVEPSHPLSLPGSCVYAAHGTPNCIFPNIRMPGF